MNLRFISMGYWDASISFFYRAWRASLVNSITLVTKDADTVSWITFLCLIFWLMRSTAVLAFLRIFSLSFILFLSFFLLDTSLLDPSKELKKSISSSMLYLSSYLNLLFLRLLVRLFGLSSLKWLRLSSVELMSSFFIFLLILESSFPLDSSDKLSSMLVLVVAPTDTLIWRFCYADWALFMPRRPLLRESFFSSGK